MSESDSSEASDDSESISNDYVTLGKSSDFETVIWRFPYTEQCPMKNCNLSCSSRVACLAHFQIHHAETCMICTICDELFLVMNPLHLLRHYQVHHPNERPPKLKEADDIPPSSETVENPQIVAHEEDIYYKIMLKGNGLRTLWNFPDVNQCPNRLCRLEFKNRLETMEHFREQHANDAVLCTLCQKPISIKGTPKGLVRHYQLIHPNAELPHDSGKYLPTRVSQTIRPRVQHKIQNETSDKGDDDDDLITLHACGITTKWRFPKDLRACFLQNCRQNFKSKSDGIKHFTENHAIGSILCKICDRPIRLSHGPNDFRKHYAHKHPHHMVPFHFGSATSASVPKIKNERNVQVKQKCSYEIDLIQLKHGKWRFPSTAQCPVIGCRIKFGNRLDAINHYKQTHAMNAVLCNFCLKPVRTDVEGNALSRHFRKLHPNQEIPYGLGKATNQPEDEKFHVEEVDQLDNNDESHGDTSNETDDMIILSGGGLRFMWKFPQSTKCPMRSCNKYFSGRSDAIDHYKENHAKKFTLCPICEKPVLFRDFGDIKHHYKRQHPNADLPSYFDKLSVRKNMGNEYVNMKPQVDESFSGNGSQPSKSTDDNCVDDDVISLSACGIITRFQFPKWTKQCPATNCRLKFEKRSDCIAHYKEWHAKGSIMCPVCVKPIRIISPCHLQMHYDRIHPNEAIPYDFETKNEATSKQMTSKMDHFGRNENDLIKLTSSSRVTHWWFPLENWQRCPAFRCHLKFETRSDAIEHFKADHTENSICCPRCDKPIVVKDIYDFKRHYDRNHPYAKFPVGIGLSTNDSQSPSQHIKEEIQDESEGDDNEEDDLIELTTNGITTQWLFPDNCRQCPVGNCRQKFRTKSDGIKHYKKLHATGSICCPVCEEPVRSVHSLYDFNNHYRRKHPHMEIPFKAGMIGFFPRKQLKHQAHVSDKNDDIIILSAFGQCHEWVFPKNLTRCPVKRCKVSSSDLEVLKKHYREIHANTAFLCKLCNKVVSTRNRIHNLKVHYLSNHPNVAMPKISRTKKSDRTTKATQLKVEIDSPNQPENMNCHSSVMHSTQQIYCPLKRCNYVAKQMTEMRTHWNCVHKGMNFPEFRDETSFTYVMDSSNMDNRGDSQKNVNLTRAIKSELLNGGGWSSKSAEQQDPMVIDSSDSGSSVMEEDLTYEVLGSYSLTKPSAWHTGIDTSNDNCDDVNGELSTKRHKELAGMHSKANGKRQRSSSSSSGCSLENLMDEPRKVARKSVYKPSDDNIRGNNRSEPLTAKKPISLDAMKECFVVLEKLNIPQATISKSAIAAFSSSIPTTSSESVYQSTSSMLTSHNKAFYVDDSDEGEAMYSSGNASTSGLQNTH